ncbi:alpha/beta-hydrolase [Lichtheimia hyalospora FSU 10163]|nr:alpha/beta-hydrolase [Lichtheimia hyalospora FSU 10163]
MSVTTLAPDSFLHGVPGIRPVIIGLFCAFVLTKSGRKLAAHVILGNIRKSLLLLPLRVRCQIIKRIFTLPISHGRRAMNQSTHPFGYQWDAIIKVNRDEVQGHWIIPKANEHGGLQWAENTVNDADLVIMYVHGGGFRLGNSLMYMSSFLHMIDRLEKVHGLRARIFSVEYRMCPEQQWPVSRQDCEKAYSYLVRDLQLDASKIVIGGDSAGGHVTATLLLSIRDQLQSKEVVSMSSIARLPLPMPKGAVMISPWANMESNSPTYTTNASKDCLPFKPGDRHGWLFPNFDNMSKDEQDALLQDPYVSPMFGNYEGVCPVLVTLGGEEVFAHDIERLIERLKENNVKVDVVSRADTVHIWAIERFLTQNQKIWLEGINKIIDWCASTVRQ